MLFHSARCLLPVFCLLFLLPACSSTPTPAPETSVVPTISATGDFKPISNLSLIRMETGRYPNLFTSGSYALWVNTDVAQAKLRSDADKGMSVDASLAKDAEYILENYIIFECHLESVFPDASIAYDVVGLRNIDIHLVTPDGGIVRPIQRILGSHANESPVGALKKFGRTNVLVFAKKDILAGMPAIALDVESVRMVVGGFNSTYFFRWTRADMEQPLPQTDIATGGLGFSDLYLQLRILARNFQ